LVKPLARLPQSFARFIDLAEAVMSEGEQQNTP
jgi:hypothetical protein